MSKQANQNDLEYEAVKENIQFDDFTKLDLRLGTVLEAEKVKKSNKLLKLEVDLGFERRTILSGIAKHYSTEEIIGKQVVVVANLAPRKMMGFESQGMVLMAENQGRHISGTGPGSRSNRPWFSSIIYLTNRSEGLTNKK